MSTKKTNKRPKTAHTQESFAKLQRQWYAKLKKTGFNDIEWYGSERDASKANNYLKQDTYQTTRTSKPGNAEYYRIMTNYWTHTEWQNPLHSKVFELHCDGMSLRNIATAVNKMNYKKCAGYPMTFRKVFYLVTKLVKAAHEWNNTSPDGLNSPAAEAAINAELAYSDTTTGNMTQWSGILQFESGVDISKRRYRK